MRFERVRDDLEVERGLKKAIQHQRGYMREGEMATRLQMKRRVRRTQGPGVERKNVSSPGSILGYLRKEKKLIS